MSVSERAFLQEEDEESSDLSLFLAAGPASLFCTLALSLQRAHNLDLILVVLLGLFLIYRWRTRGCVYAFALLLIGALCKHALFLEHHLWQFGIEASLGLGFATTALAVELLHRATETLRIANEARQQTIRHLDDDLSKARAEAIQERSALQEKIHGAQQELDDALSEMRALKQLTDLLRSSIARAEEDAIATAMNQKDERLAALQAEFDTLQRQYARLKDESYLSQENEQLTKELNAARIQREQTYLINETLARMIASHTMRSQQAEERAAALEAERASFEERLSCAITRQDKEHLLEQIQERDQALAHLQQRLEEQSRVHLLFGQLKKQFQEKTQLLHQTRVELFHTRVAYEAIQHEQREQELAEMPLSKEFVSLEEERSLLEEENRYLAAFITDLLKPAPECSNLVFDRSASMTDKDLRKEILKGFLKSSQKTLLFREFPDLADEAPRKAKPAAKKKSKKKSGL